MKTELILHLLSGKFPRFESWPQFLVVASKFVSGGLDFCSLWRQSLKPPEQAQPGNTKQENNLIKKVIKTG